MAFFSNICNLFISGGFPTVFMANSVYVLFSNNPPDCWGVRNHFQHGVCVFRQLVLITFTVEM